jgi:hypothetical protein
MDSILDSAKSFFKKNDDPYSTLMHNLTKQPAQMMTTIEKEILKTNQQLQELTEELSVQQPPDYGQLEEQIAEVYTVISL